MPARVDPSQGKAKSRRVVVRLPWEAYEKLEELSKKDHISHTAVVSQAISRMYREQQLNGSSKEER